MTWDLLGGGPKALAEFGLTWLCQSSALLALGLLAGWMLRRSGPAVQSAVYRTTLAAVLVCPVASTLLAKAGLDGLTFRMPLPAAGVGAAPASTPPTFVQPALAAPIGPGRILQDSGRPIEPPRLAATTSPEVVEPSAVPSPLMAPAEPRSIRTNLLAAGASIALATWALGALLLGLRLAVGLRRMVRLRASASPAEAVDQALCRDLAGRLRLVAPEVLRAPYLHSPCVDGLRRPAILLPDDDGVDLRDTFVHELAHLARRDVPWNLLRQVASALLWFQPLLWVLSRRMEVTAEEVCDDYVVQFGADRATYAGLLLDLAERTLPPVAPMAVGMVSLRSLLARRVVRILDSSRVLSTRVGRRGVAATLAAGLCGTILAGMLGVGMAGPRAVKAEAGDEKSPDEPVGSRKRTVVGRVVGPDGRPVAGAVVTASRLRKSAGGHYGWDADRRGLVDATSDAEGRFSLTFDDLDPSSMEDPTQLAVIPARLMVVAKAPGLGPDWAELPKAAGDDKLLTLSLPRDEPIAGRVVDLEGRAVAGAKVRVFMLYDSEGPEAIDRWRREVAGPNGGGERPQSHYFPIANEWPLHEAEPSFPAPVTTDAAGRFRLEGLGRDRMVHLEISGPSVALARVQVVTRKMAAVEGRALNDPGVFDATYHGADATIVAEPSRPIEGVVLDAATNKPLAYATVTAEGRAGSNMSIDGLITTLADSKGHYRLVGLPKGDGNRLGVHPAPDQPYFVTHGLEVPSGPGLGPVEFDIKLRRGIWIGGRVSDSKTGKPVQAEITYQPFLANDRAVGYPNFAANTLYMPRHEDLGHTDAEGRFRVVGLPGRAILGAKSVDRTYRLGVGAESIPEKTGRQAIRSDALPTYNEVHPDDFQTIAAIDPPADAAEFRRDLALDPSPNVAVHLVDPDGKPVAGAVAWGRYPETLDRGNNQMWDSHARIVVDPKATKTATFYHRGRKLAAALVVKPGDEAGTSERTVVLRTCGVLTGRVVDAAGRPVKGVVGAQPTRADDLRGGIHREEVPLGEDGRFRLDDLPPTFQYTIRAKDRGEDDEQASPKRFKTIDLARALTVETGQVVDLGTFDASTGKRVTTPKAADAPNPQPADLPINGRIVDLEGRPVAGVSVTLTTFHTPPSGDLTPWLDAVKKGEPPWTAYQYVGGSKEIPKAAGRMATTDQEGRFRLEGIGAERLVTLRLRGDTIAATDVDVVTRRIDPIPATGFSSQFGPGNETIYGADFLLTARPGRPVEGVVIDARTRQPMEGVEIQSSRFAGSDFVQTSILKTTSDARGKFRLVGLPKGKGNLLMAVPNDDQPYFQHEASVDDPPGIGPVTLEIALNRGIWITGKVTDKANGEPAKYVRLHYLPFLDNTYVQALPEFDRNGNVQGSQMRYQTSDDGSYKLVGMPGRAVVGVDGGSKPYRPGLGFEAFKKGDLNEYGYLRTYNNPIFAGKSWPLAMKEINPAEGVEQVSLDLQLDPGLTVRLKVVDPEGKPVTDVTLRCSGGNSTPGPYPGSEVQVENFAPGEKRNVIVRHEGRKLARVVRIGPGDDSGGPVVVTLIPLAKIKGRTVDADGRPMARTKIRPDVLPGGDFGISVGQVTSDADGRFEVSDVPTGCDYTMFAEAGSMTKDYSQAWVNAKVKPGETTDIGDIRFKKD